MIFSILNCFADLMWAFVVIILIIFIFGIIFDNAVASHFDSVDKNNAQQMEEALRLRANFGSLYETMVSLWSAISGGNDWMAYGELLRMLDMGELYFMIFSFYVAFCMVGLLNVVTGIFVDSAVCTRTEDEVVEGYTEDLKRTTEEVKRIFQDADTDGSGSMSFDELRILLEEPRVRAYFAGLDIEPSEVRTIFTLIDVDGSGELSFEEFVNGTMKLKGKARSIDMIAMMHDSVRQSNKLTGLCKYVEEQFTDISEQLRAAGAQQRSPVQDQPSILRKIKSLSDMLLVEDSQALAPSRVGEALPLSPSRPFRAGWDNL